jgi:hypothetical protein
VEPCEPTPPRDLQPVKGRKIRMGKPARQPQPILGQWG